MVRSKMIRAKSGGVDTSQTATSVVITQNPISAFLGISTQLSATVYNAKNQVLNRAVTWQSSTAAIASVSSAGLLLGIALGTAVITAIVYPEGKSATSTVTVNSLAIEDLVSLYNAIPGSTLATTEMIEAGRNHSLIAGSVDPIPPVSGSGASAWALHAATGAGLIYDPVLNLFNPGGPLNGSAPGTVSSQTILTALLGTPMLSDISIIGIYQAPNADNPYSYEWSVTNTDASQLLRRGAPPGGQDARWSAIGVVGFGDQEASGRGEIPYNDGQKHLITIEFGHYLSVLETPVGTHRKYAIITVDRDLGAIVTGTGDGFAAATMRWVEGQAFVGSDSPGSYRWRNVGRAVGKPTPAHRDLLYAWGRGKGSVNRSAKPLTVHSGNSYVAGLSASGEGFFKQLLAQLYTRSDFVNLGVSGFSTLTMKDVMPYSERAFVSNPLRPLVVVPYFEWLNSMSDPAATAAQLVADAKDWCTRLKVERSDVKIVMTTPVNWKPSDPVWVARAQAVRDLILNEPLGTYWVRVVNWMNQNWRYGTGAWIGDGTRDNGAQHPTQLACDELMTGIAAGVDSGNGMIPALQAVYTANGY